MKLHLGVVDVPYVALEPPGAYKKRIKAGKHPGAGHKTTGDVADILEAKYHVMEIFWQLHEEENVRDLTVGMRDALETLMVGGPLHLDPFAEAESLIEGRFRRFLTDKEMDRLGYPGVPTKASLKGVSHRFKRKRGPARPSFVDTGLYEAAFKAWSET